MRLSDVLRGVDIEADQVFVIAIRDNVTVYTGRQSEYPMSSRTMGEVLLNALDSNQEFFGLDMSGAKPI